MTSVHVAVRTTKHGEKRYLVRTRLGGRYGRLLHLGSFRTRKEADACVEWARLELAQGRVPDRRARIEDQAPDQRLVAEAAWEWLEHRHDLQPSSRDTYRQRIRRVERTLLLQAPLATVTVPRVQMFVAGLISEGLQPATIRYTMAMLRQVLDHAGIDPNPARDRRVKLPPVVGEEIQPPSIREVRLVLEHCSPRRYTLILALLEATALRISDLLRLQWGDVDVDGARFRVQAVRGKSKRSRFVPVPRELLDLIEATCPIEDRRADRQLFPGVTRSDPKEAMRRACRNAGIPLYSPHDLRHRAISRWVQSGVPLPQVAQWAGHSRSTTTLDSYAHVLVDVEEGWRHVLTLDSEIARSSASRRT